MCVGWNDEGWKVGRWGAEAVRSRNQKQSIFSLSIFKSTLSEQSKGMALNAAKYWIQKFDTALQTRDEENVSCLFKENGLWRDLLAFTTNVITLEGHEAIKDMCKDRFALGKLVFSVSNFALDPKLKDIDERLGLADKAEGSCSAWFQFETTIGRGHGFVRLRQGKAWTLFTSLYEIKGFEELAGTRRARSGLQVT